MKPLPFIIAGILVCCSCDESQQGTATKQTNTIDSSKDNRASEPTSGSGYDPTRLDATKKEPFVGEDATDTTGPTNNDKPTPGLGNPPASQKSLH